MSFFSFGAWNMMGMMSGIMTNYNGIMAMMMGYSLAFTVVGLASGALVILGSVMLYNRPFENHVWSALILAFSLVSVIGAMGGFMFGLIMGALGGIFGLVWKPATSGQMGGSIDRPSPLVSAASAVTN